VDVNGNRYRAADGIAFRTVRDGAVLVDLRSGAYFSLNATAAFVWGCLVEGRGGVDDYARAFSIDADQARRDFDAVIADLGARGFLLKA